MQQNFMSALLKRVLILATALTIVFPVFALAEVSATAGASATATAQTAAHLTALMTRLQTRAGQEIDRRVKSLTELGTRVGEIKNLSDTDKTSIQTALSTQITALNALKVKIDADTDETTLKADVKSVTDSYRIYALVLPQVRIIAAADRVVTIAKEFDAFGAKLKARIDAAAAAGADMTDANAALTDFAAKITDAQTQAQAAVSEIAALVPDNGDKTVMASNEAALKDARSKIHAAQQDIVAARKDAETIRKAVNGKPLTANANGTASTTNSGQGN